MTRRRELEPYPLRFIGNSLSPGEYREVLVKWFRVNRVKASGGLTPLATPEELADALVTEIRDREMLSMIDRFGDGEEWAHIKASSQGPPRQ